METNSRLNQLLEFYKEDPKDPFTIYALAMEYLKLDVNESRKYYELLLTEHRHYVGTYYHAAKLYIELGLQYLKFHSLHLLKFYFVMIKNSFDFQ